MKPYQKKKKLFNIFSQNLKWFLEYPRIELVSEDGKKITDGYVCPLCFCSFPEEALDNTFENPLTLEDVPPKSLGGKVRTLTCRKCNSEAGHKIDAHLANQLQLDNMWKVNSEVRARFTLGGNKVNGTFSMTEKGVVFNLLTENSHPIQSKKFIEDLKNGAMEISGAKLEFSPLVKADLRRAELGLLRAAYLYAFSELGYGMMLNGGMTKVREQLMNPEKKILPGVFWFKYDFSDDLYGFNIIREPKELRCYLIIFDLITKSGKMQCAIALPGPSSPSIGIYENIEKILGKDETGDTTIKIEHIPTEDFLLEKQFTFVSNYWWQVHCT
nr:HNH endonuclease [Fluviicola sp.]